MKYISKKDMELVRTLALLSKFEKSSQQFSSHIEQQYRENPNDITIALTYAFYHLMNMKWFHAEGEVGIQKMNYIFSSLSNVLKISPDYWLARILRCMLTLFIPESIREEETLVEDLKELIQQQEASRQEPYFLIPYIMLADYYYLYETRSLAFDILNKGIEKVPCREIKVMGDFLCIPVKDVVARMTQSGENEIVDLIKEKAQVLFPKEDFFK